MSTLTPHKLRSNKNILKIDLTGHALPFQLWKRRTDLNPQPGRYSTLDRHDIAAYVNLRGPTPSLRLFTRNLGPEDIEGPRERWHHLTTGAISFQDFKSFAQNATYEHHVDCMPVVLRLLDEVAEKFEVTSAYGSYIRPGTVIRCDGKDSRRLEVPDISATFISFPFFDIGDFKAPASFDNHALHMTRNLFQQFYPQETTNDRDAVQQFRQFRGVDPGQYLRVPQLWVLLLNSTTIISCGHRSLEAMCQDFLEIVPQTQLLTQNLKLIQVTDFYNRVTCLRADQCRSFLALETRIREECLPDEVSDVDQCSIHWEDDELELPPARWPTLLKDSQSALVNIRLRRRRSPKGSLPEKDAPETAGIDVSRMIDYTDLGIDDSPQRGDTMALVRTVVGNDGFVEPASNTIGETEAKKRKFEDQGYVYRDAKPSDNDDETESPPEGPKVFRRPTMAQVEAASTSQSDTSSVISEYSFSTASRQRSDTATQSTQGTDEASQSDENRPISADEPVRQAYVESESGSENEDPVPDSERVSHRNEMFGPSHARANTSSIGPRSAESEDRAQDSKDSSHDTDQLAIDPGMTSRVTDTEKLSSMDKPALRFRSNADEARHFKDKFPGEHPQLGALHDENATGVWDEMDPKELYKTAKAAGTRYDSDESDNEVQKRVDNELRAKLKNFGWQDFQIEKILDPQGKKAKREKQEKKLEELMRKRLALFGFQENQVQALLHPEEQNRAHASSNKKTKRSKEEKELEAFMRKRLALFGFQENQIQALVYPDEQNQPQVSSHIAHQPTYAKIHKNHLDIETLHYYDIPYEHDENPNYIIVLREMSQREVDVLFEHTRRLRNMQKDSDDDDLSLGQKQFISPKHRSRSRKAVDVSRNHTRSQRDALNAIVDRRADQGISASKKTDTHAGKIRAVPRYTDGQKKSNHQEEVRDASPERPAATLDTNIQVPPFFAWSALGDATDGGEEATSAVGLSSRVEQNETTRIDCTLFVVTKHIYPKRNDNETIQEAKNMFIYKAGSESVNIPQRFIPKKQFHELSFEAAVGDDQYWQNFDRALEKETRFMQSGDCGTVAAVTVSTSSESISKKTGMVTVYPDKDIIIQERRVLHWQMARILMELKDLRTTVKRLIDQFVSADVVHPLIQRCWGSMYFVHQTIIRLGKDTLDVLQQQSERKRQKNDLIYIVHDLPDDTYLQLHGIEGLNKPLEPCEMCRKGRQHADVDTALDHLQHFHMGEQIETLSGVRENMGHWLRSTLAVEQETRNQHMLEFLRNIHRIMKKLLVKAIDLRSSVAGEDYRKDEVYQLPVALVSAGAKTFQFVFYFAYSVKSIYESNLIPPPPKDAPVLSGLRKDTSGAEYCAKLADIDLSTARDQLLMFAYTGQNQNAIHHIRTTPESTILVLLEYLALCPLASGQRILNLYQEQLNHLASGKPSKKILRDLYLLKDEIEVVSHVFPQQRNAFLTFEKVLHGDSFRIPHKARIEAFETLERDIIQAVTIKDFLDLEAHIERMYKEADKLAEIIRHNIGILEEGNTKAIFIFTLVTSVFLPLSFVSSIFGMNTSDIRDMSSTQSLFWVVALPVTAIIGGLSLLIVFHGPALKAQLRRFLIMKPGSDSMLGKRKRLHHIEEQLPLN